MVKLCSRCPRGIRRKALDFKDAFLIPYQQARRRVQRGTLPDWYLPLRRRLPTVGGICLLALTLSVAVTVD